MDKDYLYYRELYHYGIKGQKWGIRRFENEDGTLTSAGKLRYGGDTEGTMSKKGRRQYEEDKKLEQYRSNALHDIDKRRDRDINDLSEDLKKYDKKIAKAETKGKTKRAEKLKSKQNIQRGKMYYNEILKDMEKKKVTEMSLDALKKEKNAVRRNTAKVFVSWALSDSDNDSSMFANMYMLGAKPGSKDNFREHNRLSDLDYQIAKEKADLKLQKEINRQNKKK